MTDFSWYVNRLKAMSAGEVLWRLSQKGLQKKERRQFKDKDRLITEKVFYEKWEGLTFHGEMLGISEEAGGEKAEALPWGISLSGGYPYESYERDWHAGFQTEKKWEKEFSYELRYKQRDDVGDARTNWELNRHFQFAMLSRNFYVSGQKQYLELLHGLFFDWNRRNPFLTGISWTSVMEAAIRDINWIYTLGFLERSLQEAGNIENTSGLPRKAADMQRMMKELSKGLRAGIINMTGYVAGHYSRYSSANNHVIVEACALGIAGIVMDCGEWFSAAADILTREIPRQNYEDGVNREASLHYQSFFMEAVGLLVLVMRKNQRPVPKSWISMLVKMSRYLSDCRGDYGETVVFGDDDAGKILDFCGRRADHYGYVLELMSLILPERFVEDVEDGTLLALTDEPERAGIQDKAYRRSKGSVCYEKGGVSLLRSPNRKALIGIDHGELGFGSIAAHGHADALSFQMFLEGQAVFADAGTYIYHIDLSKRNEYRSTACHNTLELDGRDQSEMLGAFLWGKRARTTLTEHNVSRGGGPAGQPGEGENVGESEEKERKEQIVEACHDGYAPVIHRRRFTFNGQNRMEIRDYAEHMDKEHGWKLSFLLGKDVKTSGVQRTEEGFAVVLACGQYEVRMHMKREKACKAGGKPGQDSDVCGLACGVEPAFVSQEYGREEASQRVILSGSDAGDFMIVTEITWEKR